MPLIVQLMNVGLAISPSFVDELSIPPPPFASYIPDIEPMLPEMTQLVNVGLAVPE